MRTEGTERKVVEEEEERTLRGTAMNLKTVERVEAKRESEETQEVVESGAGGLSKSDKVGRTK